MTVTTERQPSYAASMGLDADDPQVVRCHRVPVTALLTMLTKQRLGLQQQHCGALGHMIVMGKLASGVVQSARTGNAERTTCVRCKPHEDKVRQAFAALAVHLSGIEHVTSQ